MHPKISKQLPKNPEAIKILKDMSDQGFTSEKIRDRLEQEFGHKWSIETIRRCRAKLIPNKSNNIIPIKENTNPTLSTPPPGFNQIEKAQWFRDQFKKSHLFKNLKNQFTIEEITGYLEEYGNLCCQFEDIVFSEFFQIDDFLKHRILVDRQLNFMRTLQEEVNELNEWLLNNPIKEDESKEKKQERVSYFQKIEGARTGLNRAADRYDKLVAERNRISSNLAATRKDRIEELKGGKESFFSLVATIQASEAEREKQGKYAVLTKLASEDIKEAFRKPVELADGSREPLLMDDSTFLKEDSENE
jgi:hypothetical protein